LSNVSQSGVLVRDLVDRIMTKGGAALIADYGHSGEKGDTLRAFKDRRKEERKRA
jgi:NADH dehydrogenase [ubiquinone] 1 alpha subcomplex assembly factor 7